ncbi:hypothetical protein POM88_005782 [Heracleum sosnowskyi]|uniref:Uncharacterized protein n=1 Tax=Heracleum sosnowskyi TaxID=360622 RepID=A0AAD8J1E8_9APIA|nr:hypothetical protein POM88_005782 [Heracleum sosnowskyi]
MICSLLCGATAFLDWMGIQVEFENSKVSHFCSASSVYLPLAAQIDIAALEDSIGYQFNNKGLLVQAFVHPSYSYHSGGCYQRLEFLGDAVLDYLVTSYLYSVYPKLKPGQLTDLRSACVNNISFANIAIHRSFYKFIISESSGLCKSMDKYVKFSRTHQLNGNVVEAPACPKALGVESCIGAILLDTGFNLNQVWKIMLSFLDPVINFSGLQLNPIRELQELCQAYNMEFEFASTEKENTYIVEAKVNGKDVSEYSSASNFSKKAAKRESAKQMILVLKELGFKPKSTRSLEEIMKFTYKRKRGASSSKVHPLGVGPHRSGGTEIESVRELPSLPDPLECQTTSGSFKKSAKSLLYEICAANNWDPPAFVCCKDEGENHLRKLTYRVIVKPDWLPKCFIDAMGRPARKKKVAEEHAAEGTIWHLKNHFL